ncbi:uracil-DNA glycosylase [Rhizobium sp.]|uniref:uracil-DNA glycosylase n=1 Tax=Rhizobium sp. TaxID=391 RepID=UPI000E80FEB5|nr:uracil-DNA glycosylase [Rhizobium sp.]
MAQAGLRLEESWKAAVGNEFEQPHMQSLKQFLLEEKQAGKHIFPKGAEYFRALDLTPIGQVRVVILGQDPYHGAGQAHGLCFSVQPGVRIPPSLLNIYKEMESDLGIARANHGFLEHWARQGVLLLNSVLTVEEGRAGSHQGKGWERFTDRIIHAVAEEREHVVFILWGAYAQKKAAFVDPKRHLVLKSVHPSPLSAHNGFFGSKPFSKTNAYLQSHGLEPIDWQLPEKAQPS